ncbi:GNAT family N-acetyltransferase [Pseudomonas rubra]|uniref:GNAT family N-acetyltransferase n=1 Tax=Pseudomonas rubra TaxID=2942627 RepID=A0ABT5PBQ2_9PSED|nr:GNAT family N-acetyltransferase [Pseudomonas rubra]MDD1015732.1 GNAT family N-acetyltransferase [Pseudomonas rubra]MDD1040354.1 GNAT family N-acetyltransferase [Pseudomonas rubra]MDD1157440.1 GNAT family N-acetyltransferase [Pseudomonas rubra]
MTAHIEFTCSPSEQQREAILKPLRAHNISQAGEPQLQTFAWSLRDPHSGEASGGLYGKISSGWMFIELLAVPESLRGHGLGRDLMALAEARAREAGCLGIWLDTFSFQAPAFYRKLGFTVFGELADYPPGHTRYFMRKLL